VVPVTSRFVRSANDVRWSWPIVALVHCGALAASLSGCAAGPRTVQHPRPATESPKLLRYVQTRELAAFCVAASGRRMAAEVPWGAPGVWGEITLYDTTDWRPVRTVREKDLVQSLALSPDGRLLAAGDWRGSITVWSTPTGAVVRRLGPHPVPGYVGPVGVQSVFFVLGGKRLISGGEDGAVSCWDVRTGRRLWRRKLGPWVWGLALATDGRHLAAALGKDGAALCIAGPEGTVRTLRSSRFVSGVAFCGPGGRQLATAALGSLTVWDVNTGRRVRVLRRQNRKAAHIAASDDGRYVAVSDETGLTVWRTADWTAVAEWTPAEGRASALALAPDGSWLVTNRYGTGFSVWGLAAR